MLRKLMSGCLVLSILFSGGCRNSELEKELADQKQENAKLREQIQGLNAKIAELSPAAKVEASADASSMYATMGDLFSAPENYIGKKVSVEGVLSAEPLGPNPRFLSDAGGFLLARSEKDQMLIICAFDQTLDASFRQQIGTLHPGSSVVVSGQLVSIDKSDLFKKVGWGVIFRYGIIVSAITVNSN